MNAYDFYELSKHIKNAFPKSYLNKWVSHDDYEEIVLEDSNKNTWEIKFYPVKGTNQ